MTEKERDKILRNLKSNEPTWKAFDDAAKIILIEHLIDEMVQDAEKNMVGASLDGVYIFAVNLKTRLENMLVEDS
ncbi:MAG: hypothetical protein J6U54_07575 [Clostridiales bacterium]|nr:hypothetical protein [Clostridiales bacterium]